jgi:hypothetical protein
MRKFLLLAALLALAAPTAYAAPPAGKGNSESASTSSGQGPAALCKEQRRTLGAETFRLNYPTAKGKSAFGKCVSSQSQLVASNQENAAKTCKAERGVTTESVSAFNTKWGKNANTKNAFGKCVSSTAQKLTEDAQEATLNAAKTCKAERGTTAETVSAFNAKWGKNANKKNAFGKCVSDTAKKQNESDD